MNELRSIGIILVILVLGWILVGLSGCAATERGESDVVAGFGKTYETRADVESDTPVLRMDIVRHCEQREQGSAIRDFVGVLDNTLGWTKVITSVATSPERVAGEAIGNDRSEKVATLTLDDPHKADIPAVIEAWVQSVEVLNQQTESCEIFATAS